MFLFEPLEKTGGGISLICHYHSSMRPTVCQVLPGNQANGKKVIMSLQDGKQEIYKV